jgi:hypothetical protein
MTARINLIAAVMAAAVLSCDTDRNVAPVYESYFTKYYGEDGNQIGVDLAIGGDGTMVMVGTSQSLTNPIRRGFIVKVDAQGTVLWERRMGGDNEVPVDVELDSRNDILVVSNVQPSAPLIPTASIRVTRISQSGAGIDSTLITYENENVYVDVFGTAVTEIGDGSLMVTGSAGPGLVVDNNLIRSDVQDLLVFKVDPSFAQDPELKVEQGGEHVGKIIKFFQSRESGPQRFYSFGDSDRPFNTAGAFIQTFETLKWNEDYIAAPSNPTVPAPADEERTAKEAIEVERGYLMVGTTGQGLFSKIYVAQYIDNRPNITTRFSQAIQTPRSAEGISVAYGEQESILVLADELQDNNNHDIYLLKMRYGEGGLAIQGEIRFGSVEGDDQAAAVRILPDQRIAVFGTIELETQKKMMLTLVSPTGTFSE